MRLIGKVVARLPISRLLGPDGQTESIRGLCLSRIRRAKPAPESLKDGGSEPWDPAGGRWFLLH